MHDMQWHFYFTKIFYVSKLLVAVLCLLSLRFQNHSNWNYFEIIFNAQNMI